MRNISYFSIYHEKVSKILEKYQFCSLFPNTKRLELFRQIQNGWEYCLPKNVVIYIYLFCNIYFGKKEVTSFGWLLNFIEQTKICLRLPV